MTHKQTSISLCGMGEVFKYLHNKGIKISDDLFLAAFGEIQNLDVLFSNLLL
jgi:hypothetical protein